jgi:hypothetical protein
MTTDAYYGDYPYGEQYGTKEEKLLARLRNRFDYAKEYWNEIYTAGDEDMRYVALDPWPPAEKRMREQAVRPCLVMDEINQNVNQLINSVRQNKRSVKIVPRGYGANDKKAELRGDKIREIEYRSNAQSAYICGFENICNRSFGGWKIVRRFVNEKSFDQELVIVRIPNPKSSYPDPDCKEQDFSDAKFWFLLDLCPRREYRERYPKATIVDFDSEQYKQATNWITQDAIQVAEYWEVQTTKRKLYHIKTDAGAVPMFADELPEGFDAKASGKLLDERETCQHVVKQYITNGLEILEENDEPGRYIPIVWGTGKELYLDDGSGPKRMLVSLVRGARDPQMMVNYAATAAAEAVGMTPKTPFIGVAGQFHNPDTWQNVATVPVAFLEYKAKIDGIMETLPPPQRQPYEPMIEPLQMVQESARRSVQSGMGLAPLPTNAQKINDKSGIALQTIDDNEDRGTFHFIDNFEMMLEHNGRVLNDKIPFVYDGERMTGFRNSKDEHRTAKINSREDPDSDMTVGEFDITVTTGPSFQSEREESNEFVKTVIPQLENLIQDPALRQKLLALLVKTRNIGPMGDEIVNLLDPKDDQQQQLSQLQMQVQQSQQIIVGLKTENDKLYAEKQGKVVDNEYMLKAKQLDNEMKLAIAEITAKAQDATARATLTADLMKELHVAAHDAAKQAVQHAHEQKMQESQQQAQQQMAQQPPPNGQTPQPAGAAQ